MTTPIFVLHCSELPDRTEQVRKHIAERALDHQTTFYRSYHGKTWGLDTTLEYDRGQRISPGHVGLNVGVWSLWQHIHLTTAAPGRSGASPHDHVIIFEDDVELPWDFSSHLINLEIELRYDFDDWDLVFLGLAEVEPHVWNKVTERIGKKPDSRLCRLNDPFGTHAYMVRRRALPILLDNMTAAHRNLDQQLWERVLKPGKLKWCAVLPSIVRQRTYDYKGTGKPEWNPSTVEIGEEGYKGPALTTTESDVQRMLGGKDVGGKSSPELIAMTSLLVDPFPCIYRGEMLDDHGIAENGRTIPLNQCGRLDFPCHSKTKTGVVFADGGTNGGKIVVKPCETCEIRTGMQAPTKRERLPLPDGHFNPSIIKWHDRLILATRDSWGHSKVALWYLNNSKEDWSGEWTCEPIGSYKSEHPEMPRLEDPRLFVNVDKRGNEVLCCMFNCPDGYPPKRVQVGYVEFDQDLTQVVDSVIYGSPNGSLYEKNWVPFFGDGELNWIYGTKPEHIIFNGKDVYKTPNPLPWVGGVIRGGSSPVLVHDVDIGDVIAQDPVYYHFFHGCLKRVQGSVYTVGCAVFEAKPPYRVLRQTPTPLVWPDLPATGEDVVKRYVVWPGGAVPHKGAWHLALGIDDCHCKMIRIPFGEVEASLSDVPETTVGVSLRDTPLALGIPETEAPNGR